LKETATGVEQPVKAAQSLFRHSSLATTEDYLHPTHEDLRARMRQVEK